MFQMGVTIPKYVMESDHFIYFLLINTVGGTDIFFEIFRFY